MSTGKETKSTREEYDANGKVKERKTCSKTEEGYKVITIKYGVKGNVVSRTEKTQTQRPWWSY